MGTKYRTCVGAAAFVHHPSSLQHDTGAHPERAARITAIEAELEARGWPDLERRLAPAAEPELLEAVHPPEHVAAIAALAARGGGAIDIDTVMSAGSYEAALHAAGGAAHLVDLLLAGEFATGMSALRPPGHHAERARAMGFCLFNNVAVAARHALDAHGLERILVLDWDVHHGNGTADIFEATDEVLFVSIHEWPLYPGTGAASEVGSGPGEGYTVNLPVPGGSGDEVWCSLVEHVAVALARAYDPQLVLVSAGYDAHADDPLADCRVTDRGYAAMTGSVRRLAEELGVPFGFVLEGGYELGALAGSVAATLETATAAAQAPPAPAQTHPLAERARALLAPRWPALSAA
jgi:acetoin utilization deacetylase AcuC-like enzyme